MNELKEYINTLEKEIRFREVQVKNHIDHKNWNQANNQEWYLQGLNIALHLAKSAFIIAKANK